MIKKTNGQKYHEDPRIIEAKRLITETLAEHATKITQVKPADPELEQSYQELTEKFAKDRGGKLYYNYIGKIYS
ncbi:hypothetical protein EB155_02975 [archaeon]|nr:hypothetical protein [archaeon]NDB54946.1 hypothetical protein [archaeon]NDB78805.1 hypothetical protein [archaeon]